jgi:hypothetical protein
MAGKRMRAGRPGESSGPDEPRRGEEAKPFRAVLSHGALRMTPGGAKRPNRPAQSSPHGALGMTPGGAKRPNRPAKSAPAERSE